MIASISRRGCPYDNACIESFHATIKKEKGYLKRLEDYETARITLFQYIGSWYNRKRNHGSVGYVAPDQYEKMCRVVA